MRWGKDEKFYAAIIKAGGQLGTNAKQKVTVPEEVRIYWESFWFLSRRRECNDTGLQPIQISEMESYIRLRGIFGYYQVQSFLKFVSVLDDEYVSYAREEHSRRSRMK